MKADRCADRLGRAGRLPRKPCHVRRQSVGYLGKPALLKSVPAVLFVENLSYTRLPPYFSAYPNESFLLPRVRRHFTFNNVRHQNVIHLLRSISQDLNPVDVAKVSTILQIPESRSENDNARQKESNRSIAHLLSSLKRTKHNTRQFDFSFAETV